MAAEMTGSVGVRQAEMASADVKSNFGNKRRTKAQAQQ